MKVYRTDKRITRGKIKENPDVLYLFGDNLIRKGLGGQAKEMRGEPNTVGIVTKKYPSNEENSFFTDLDYKMFRDQLALDLGEVRMRINSGEYKALVIPQIGGGLARLPEKAPMCWELLQKVLNKFENFV